VPTLVAPDRLLGARIVRGLPLEPLLAVAFAMGTHRRLGAGASAAGGGRWGKEVAAGGGKGAGGVGGGGRGVGGDGAGAGGARAGEDGGGAVRGLGGGVGGGGGGGGGDAAGGDGSTCLDLMLRFTILAFFQFFEFCSP